MKSLPAVKRRSFLAVAAMLPAAAVAAAVASRARAPAAVEPAATAAAPAASGYHETEHIRKYYRSAEYL